MNTLPEKTAERITLQQAKDEVAKHHGFHDWDNFLSEMADESRTAIVADYTDEAWVIHTELNELIERSEQDRKEIEELKYWQNEQALLLNATADRNGELSHELTKANHSILSLTAENMTLKEEIERLTDRVDKMISADNYLYVTNGLKDHIKELESEIERLKEVARQDYRIVIEAEVDWYKDRIKELKSENEMLKEAYKHFRKMRDYWHQEAIKYQNRSRELEEALRELISLDERTNVAGEIMSDSQGTVDCFPSPTEWRIAFDKAYKSLTKESAPSKEIGDKYIQFFKGQDQKVIQVLYAESWYELADISYEFGVTWMHIYDEPPSRHIDRVKWASITNIRIKPITE